MIMRKRKMPLTAVPPAAQGLVAFRSRSAAALAIALAMLLAGCATPPQEHYFLLESAEATSGAAVDAAAGGYAGDLLVNVAAIPESIDRPQLVLRRGPNEAGVLEFDRWAEPVRGGIARVLAEGLGHALPGAWVSTSGLRRSGESINLGVSIDAMEASPEGDARLAMAWTLRRNGEETASGGRLELHRHLAATTPAAAVAAWSSELAEAARDIAQAIAAAPAPSQDHKGA